MLNRLLSTMQRVFLVRPRKARPASRVRLLLERLEIVRTTRAPPQSLAKIREGVRRTAGRHTAADSTPLPFLLLDRSAFLGTIAGNGS